jgi:hypothetical protein
MAVRSIWYAAPLLLLLGCASETGKQTPDDIDLTQLLPASSSLDGLNVADGPANYLSDTLYEYMDGAAPRYLVYGFRELVHVRYELEGDPLASVTLDILDMGSKLGAFGIYRSGMPAGAVLQDWGAEGHRSGTVAEAWKDRIYVQGVADDDRTALISVLDRLMSLVCREVAGDTSLPTILASLPPDGLVPQSERYVAADLLGHAFLPGGLRATYDIEGHEAELFFSDLGSEEVATEAMASLRDFQSEWGTIIHEVPSIGAGGYRFSDPGLGSGIAVGVSHYVAGVYGDLLFDTQRHLLNLLVDRLREAHVMPR